MLHTHHGRGNYWVAAPKTSPEMKTETFSALMSSPLYLLLHGDSADPGCQKVFNHLFPYLSEPPISSMAQSLTGGQLQMAFLSNCYWGDSVQLFHQ